MTGAERARLKELEREVSEFRAETAFLKTGGVGDGDGAVKRALRGCGSVGGRLRVVGSGQRRRCKRILRVCVPVHSVPLCARVGARQKTWGGRQDA